MNEPRLLSALDVAARLTEALIADGARLEAQTGASRAALLDMIALARGFSRPVLRYLKLRRVYVEWDAHD